MQQIWLLLVHVFFRILWYLGLADRHEASTDNILPIQILSPWIRETDHMQEYQSKIAASLGTLQFVADSGKMLQKLIL